MDTPSQKTIASAFKSPRLLGKMRMARRTMTGNWTFRGDLR
jgi:hypothetical protein